MDHAPLKRVLGLPLLVFYGLGNILGAGIYVLVGKVAGVAGYAAPLSFLLASVVAAFTALSYAELSARYPLSAGEAVYIQAAFRRRWLSTVVGLLIAVAGVVSAAAISRGFVGYLQVFIGISHGLAVTLLLVCLGLLAAAGVRLAVSVAALMTVVEIAGLLIIIVAGAPAVPAAPLSVMLLPPTELVAWSGIFAGAFLAFYAYLGFEDMVNVAEEVAAPQRTMPLGIVIALLLSGSLYLAVAMVALSVVPPAQLAASDAPLAAVYQNATGHPPTIISLISIFAIINGALIQIIMVSRILYGMSRQGWLPSRLGELSGRQRVPRFAVVVVTISVWLLSLGFPLVTLARGTSYVVLAVFLLVNLALLRIKHAEPVVERVRSYPMWVPIVGALSGLMLVMVELLAA